MHLVREKSLPGVRALSNITNNGKEENKRWLLCYVFLLCMRIISHSQFSCIYSLVKLPITGVTDIYLVNMQHNLSVNMTVSSLLLSWLPRQSGQCLYEETSYFL